MMAEIIRRRCYVIQLASYLRREQFLIFRLIHHRSGPRVQDANSDPCRAAKRPMKRQFAEPRASLDGVYDE